MNGAAPIDLVYTWVDGLDPSWRRGDFVWRAAYGNNGTLSGATGLKAG